MLRNINRKSLNIFMIDLYADKPRTDHCADLSYAITVDVNQKVLCSQLCSCIRQVGVVSAGKMTGVGMNTHVSPEIFSQSAVSVTTNLGKAFMLDYRLTQTPTFKSTYLETDHKVVYSYTVTVLSIALCTNRTI